jgi:hypothetical protein
VFTLNLLLVNLKSNNCDITLSLNLSSGLINNFKHLSDVTHSVKLLNSPYFFFTHKSTNLLDFIFKLQSYFFFKYFVLYFSYLD